MVVVVRRNSVTKEDTLISFQSSPARAAPVPETREPSDPASPENGDRLDLDCRSFQRNHLVYFQSSESSFPPALTPSDGYWAQDDPPPSDPTEPDIPRPPLRAATLKRHVAEYGDVQKYRESFMVCYCRLQSCIAAKDQLQRLSTARQCNKAYPRANGERTENGSGSAAQKPSSLWKKLRARDSREKPLQNLDENGSSNTQEKRSDSSNVKPSVARHESGREWEGGSLQTVKFDETLPSMFESVHIIQKYQDSLASHLYSRVPPKHRSIPIQRYTKGLRAPELGSDGKAIKRNKIDKEQVMVDFNPAPSLLDDFEGLYTAGSFIRSNEVAAEIEYLPKRNHNNSSSTQRPSSIVMPNLTPHGLGQFQQTANSQVEFCTGCIDGQECWGGRTFQHWDSLIFRYEHDLLSVWKSK